LIEPGVPDESGQLLQVASSRVKSRGEGIGRFQKLVKDYIAEVAETRLQALTPAHQPSTFPLAMRAQFFAGAVLSLLTWWLENNMPLSPRQMAQYLLARHDTATFHL
jgi:hypothetical protein